jgi:predicted NAD/FAD-binding protein
MLDAFPSHFARLPSLAPSSSQARSCSRSRAVARRPLASLVRTPGGGCVATDAAGESTAFDRVVFACDAETVLKSLANPTWCALRCLACCLARGIRVYVIMIMK